MPEKELPKKESHEVPLLEDPEVAPGAAPTRRRPTDDSADAPAGDLDAPAGDPAGADAAPADGLEGPWTQERADALQQAVDEIFGQQKGKSDVGQLVFSFTIADPGIDGCPLIGCSTGFGTLCGYEFSEIVGRNCRFLVDPVPKEMMDVNVRRIAREFCEAVADGEEYKLPKDLRQPWMPEFRPNDEGVFLVQTNARKDGSLFRNMFYLKPFELNDRAYIVGLQTELPEGKQEISAAHDACKVLDTNMGKVERLFASRFWMSTSMRRQDDSDEDDGFDPFGSD